jgi:hypothetical protein
MTVRVIPHLPINLPPPTIPTKNHRQKRGAILHLTNPINLRTNPDTNLPVHLPLINHPHPHRINPLQSRHTNRLINLPHRINPLQNRHTSLPLHINLIQNRLTGRLPGLPLHINPIQNRRIGLPHLLHINPLQDRHIDLPHHHINPILSPEVLLIDLHVPHVPHPHGHIPKAQAVPPGAPLPGRRHPGLLQSRRLKRNKQYSCFHTG